MLHLHIKITLTDRAQHRLSKSLKNSRGKHFLVLYKLLDRVPSVTGYLITYSNSPEIKKPAALNLEMVPPLPNPAVDSQSC